MQETAFRTLADRSKRVWVTYHVTHLARATDFFFQANKNSWILWVNNDDVQTTEHKSAVPLISFCKRNIFFSFLEGKRWWRRSHRWLTCYSFYADRVYIFNYTCIRFLFHYLFLVCSTNGMRWKKKFSGREFMQSKTDKWIQNCKHIFQRNFHHQYSFLNISY